jgi:molecular chaperone DnaK
MNEVEARHEQLRTQVEVTRSDRARGLLMRLDDQGVVPSVREEVASATTDESAAVSAEARIRGVQAELDDIEEELRVPEVLERVRDQIEHCRDLVDRVGAEEDRTELVDIERGYAELQNTRDVPAAEQLSEQALDLQVRLLRRDGSLDVEIFNALRASQERMSSPAQARELVREGERLIATSNWPALPSLNRRLRALLPDDGRGSPNSGIQQERK